MNPKQDIRESRLGTSALTLKHILTIAVLALVSFPCLAHQDRILKLDDYGQLEGLPPKYTPASLRIAFSPEGSDRPPVISLELKVADKTTVVPVCVTGLVRTRSLKDVFVTASWYHDRSTLPHYVNINLYDPGNEGADNRPGYSLLFNLTTARLIRMQVEIVRNAGKSIQYVPVDLAERCSPSELKGFFDGIGD